MQVLITGGCGFIGSHLVEYHLKRGDRVVVVDNLSTGRTTNLAAYLQDPRLTLHKADLLTWTGLDETLPHCQRVYHLAAVVGMFEILREPVNLNHTNILATERLLGAVSQQRHKPKVMITSSSSVYGHYQEGELRETNYLTVLNPQNPFSVYAVSKIADESLAIAHHWRDKLEVVILRLFNTIGPRQVGFYGMVVPRFVEQACQNQPLTVFGDGTQTRSFCDVRDTAAAIERLVDNPKTNGEIINVGNQQEITILKLAELVKSLAKSTSPITFVPYQEAYGKDWIEITQRCPNLDKFYQLCNGFKHQWSLEATISDLIHRYRTQQTSSGVAPEI